MAVCRHLKKLLNILILSTAPHPTEGVEQIILTQPINIEDNSVGTLSDVTN